MPFVSLGTLLVHDKTLLGILSEMDTEFTEIRGITNIASSHSDSSDRIRPPSLLSAHTFVPDLLQLYLNHTFSRYKKIRAAHAAASIKGINHCWRKLFIRKFSQGHDDRPELVHEGCIRGRLP